MDGSYILEFFKDERKQEAKSTILLQFCTGVTKVGLKEINDLLLSTGF